MTSPTISFAAQDFLGRAKKSFDSLKDDEKAKREQEEARAEKYAADKKAFALSLIPDCLKSFAFFEGDDISIAIPGYALISHRVEFKDHGFGTEIEGAELSKYHYGDNEARSWKTYQYKAYEGEVGLRYANAPCYEDLSLALGQAQALGDNKAQAEIDAQQQLKKSEAPQLPKAQKVCPLGFNHETGLHLTCLLEKCAIFNQVSQDCSLKVISFLTENPYRVE